MNAWIDGVVIAVLVTGAAVAQEEAPQQRPGAKHREQEQARGERAARVPRDDESARSAAAVVQVGPYVSVQVNVDGQGLNIVGDAANEPSIAVHPTLDHFVVGWREFASSSSGFREAGYAYSHDGGASWTFPGVLQPGSFRTDPIVEYDSSGTVFYSSSSGGAVSVFRSFNSGVTWQGPTGAFGGDKNWMIVDRSGGPGDGNLYGVWRRDAGCCGVNSLTRSADGALTYRPPAPCGQFSPGLGTMAIGTNSDLYVAGVVSNPALDLTQPVVTRSQNVRFPGVLMPTFVDTVLDLGGDIIQSGLSTYPNQVGIHGQVYVGVDRSGGPNHGNAYILASVLPTGAPQPTTDVHIIRSLDDGATWSAPLKVNDDVDPGNLNWQWFGMLSIAPNGRLDVAWNDTRAGGVANMSELMYSYSYDGGLTWSENVAVSPPFDSYLGFPVQAKIGDYNDMKSDLEGAHIAYAATFNGEQDIYYVRVFPDCNGNGISDETDLLNATSADANATGIPDECELGVQVPTGFSGPVKKRP